eukprot:tig00001301_g8082.t1
MPGFLVGLLGAISTALYYTWVGTLQSDLEVSSLQLLMYQAPLSALFLIPFAPILDDFFSPAGLLNFSWTNDCLMLLFISGCLSFFVNVSMYLVIGSTSPISYQVLGYFKHIFTVTGEEIALSACCHGAFGPVCTGAARAGSTRQGGASFGLAALFIAASM